MQNKKALIAEIDLVSTLKMLTQAYEEISVLKMQKVRGSVLKTREFLSGLSEVFYDVKYSYQKQIDKMLAKRHIKPGTTISLSTKNKNGKTVSVLLSANNKLYGSIIPEVLELFTESIKKSSSDIVVVGRVGKELFEQVYPDREFKYFEIPDSDVALEDLKQFVSFLINYEKVNVFYGRFLNIMTQIPTVSSVSGDQPMEASQTVIEVKYLFEPSLERLMEFFETQIFVSLFMQTVHETHLARLASRIKAMETALGNIEQRSFALNSEKRKIKRSADNKKQLEMIAGISLWEHSR